MILKNDVGHEEVVENAHDRDAVHAVGPTAMTWQGVSEVFDTNSAFESGSEEANERGEKRGI